MPSIRTSNTSTYPQDKRTLRGDISHPTSVANEHREDARVSQPIERPPGPDRLGIASQSRGASDRCSRGHCSKDSDEDGKRPERPEMRPLETQVRDGGPERPKTRPPETRSNLEPWSRKRPQEPRQVRDGGPERPGNQIKNAKVNLHPSKNPKNPSVSEPQQPKVLICQSKRPKALTLGIHCWARMRQRAGTKGAGEKRVHKHTKWVFTLRAIRYVTSDPDESVKGCVKHHVCIVGR